MFDSIALVPDREGFRWRLAEDDGGQPTLFPEEALVDRHVGIGEYRGLEFLHVNAKRIINPVPAGSRMDFRFTINAYRGCSHACVYCVSGDTPVLMADGRTREIRELRVGDAVVGTEWRGRYRRYVASEVLDYWSVTKPAFRITLDDGSRIVTSGDHRFLSNRGWKHVADAPIGQRPHLTTNNWLLGPGRFCDAPKHDDEFRRGYLTGMIRGEGTLGAYRGTSGKIVYAFRLALKDGEALRRSRAFLSGYDIETYEFLFSPGSERHCRMDAIRTGRRRDVEAVRHLIQWPSSPSESWRKGFLAGLFDAEGSYSRGVLRFANTDAGILGWLIESLRFFELPHHVEGGHEGTNKVVHYVRLVGGLSAHLRFFLLVDPAITRKRTFLGQAVKNSPERKVRSVEALDIEIPMFDITTSTGDFVANGVISHNCFARPTHEYLGLGIGEDFERKLVVKVNAVERVRAELRSPKWGGDLIAMGTNTDPYQRAEGKYHLTRGIIEVLGDAANPFSILTKSTLVLRDLDLLVRAATRTEVRCALSIGTLDEKVWKRMEPGTPHPKRRVEAVRRLNDAGIPTGVLVAPIIPGLSDGPEQIDEVIGACLDVGATSVNAVPLHLRPGVKDHFLAVLRDQDPEAAARLERRYRGAYLPKSDQEEISRRVRQAKGRHPSRLPT